MIIIDIDQMVSSGDHTDTGSFIIGQNSFTLVEAETYTTTGWKITDNTCNSLFNQVDTHIQSQGSGKAANVQVWTFESPHQLDQSEQQTSCWLEFAYDQVTGTEGENI